MITILHFKHLQTTIYHTMDLSTDMVHVTAIKKGNKDRHKSHTFLSTIIWHEECVLQRVQRNF